MCRLKDIVSLISHLQLLMTYVKGKVNRSQKKFTKRNFWRRRGRGRGEGMFNRGGGTVSKTKGLKKGTVKKWSGL